MNVTADLITPEHVAEFERDGAIKIAGAIGKQDLAMLEAAFADLASNAHDMSNYYADDPANNGTRGLSLTRAENWRANAAFRDFVMKSHLPEMAARVMQSEEVRLFEDLLIYRGPCVDGPPLARVF